MGIKQSTKPNNPPPKREALERETAKKKCIKNTTNLDGGLELQKIGLADEHLLGDLNELPDLRLRQLRLLRRPTVLHLQEPPDYVVQQRLVHRHHTNRTIPPLPPPKKQKQYSILQTPKAIF